jgi:hypothetical protein
MQGSFDSAETSLREIPAALKMTTWLGDETVIFRADTFYRSAEALRHLKSLATKIPRGT